MTTYAEASVVEGEMPEWSNGADSKSVVRQLADRGFESLFLRKISGNQMQNPVN